MKAFDFGELTLLAAIWGASFLFMRLGAHEFGPIAMAAMRVTGASLMLLPLLALRSGQAGLGQLRTAWRPLFLVSLMNCSLPFICFSYAALSITAGLSSIMNATTPLFGAIVAWIWLSQRLSPLRMLGLAIGFAGVIFLAWDKASFKTGGSGWAIVACLVAAASYGVAAIFNKRYLSHVAPLAVATGSQMFSALTLAVPAALLWPAVNPSAQAWMGVTLLALLCSGVAYILFFRLMSRVGPTNTIAVTFLIPVFAVVWGFAFLGEAFNLQMAIGCAIVLAGTALAVGLIGAKNP
ncbi:DMT family transporter [Roseateles toxinivorans]|uniref:EamA domain-containing membrane protein RarD n=1 Tax=Roseateles toxinivorans TaxID=270368 RepID=A0A4R6QUX9_9BURK|nr:DMT family transporter [Roseateles toxinivorans]TDP75002.1 EamA domain-containing membrane protein RarD [Roseateles toxinivorans]